MTLHAPRETVVRLSTGGPATVVERQTVVRLSTAADETVVPDMAAIDRRRAAARLTVLDVLAEANMRSNTWYDALKPHAQTRPSTRRRLLAAIERLASRGQRRRRPDFLKPFVFAIEHMLRAELQADALARFLAANGGHACPAPRLGDGELPERLRAYAIYLATVECEVENATLARALGCKRQHVHQTRLKVEAMRDNAGVDALLDVIAQRLKGEP